MKKIKLGSIVTGMVGLAALLVVAASPAKAAFVVGGENGWQMSFDGMVNVFAVYGMQSNVLDGNDNRIAQQADQSFRVRTGLLPNIIGFNVKSPTIDGVDYGARLALDPQNQNSGTRNGFGPSSDGGGSLDLREIFLTADGCFGQLLAGRALNLFQGKNILTDMTLMGVGVAGSGGSADLTGGGTTLGRIGYGYDYANFGAQFRYTTPDFKGFKWALEIGDPSKISGSGLSADTINQPRFETELSYATTYPGGKMQTWLSALYQEAKFGQASTPFNQHKVASIGGAGGVEAAFGPVDVVISRFGGKALGLTLMQDTDALDASAKERITYGGLAQVQYTIGKVRLGAQYGINYADRTDRDVTDSQAAYGAGNNIAKSQQAATGGVYYNVNKYFTVAGEYTWARDSFYNSSARVYKNYVSVGTIFVW